MGLGGSGMEQTVLQVLLKFADALSDETVVTNLKAMRDERTAWEAAAERLEVGKDLAEAKRVAAQYREEGAAARDKGKEELRLARDEAARIVGEAEASARTLSGELLAREKSVEARENTVAESEKANAAEKARLEKEDARLKAEDERLTAIRKELEAWAADMESVTRRKR